MRTYALDSSASARSDGETSDQRRADSLCLTLSSGSLDRATVSVHTAREVADHLDLETLERVARLGLGTVEELMRPAEGLLINPDPASPS